MRSSEEDAQFSQPVLNSGLSKSLVGRTDFIGGVVLEPFDPWFRNVWYPWLDQQIRGWYETALLSPFSVFWGTKSAGGPGVAFARPAKPDPEGAL